MVGGNFSFWIYAKLFPNTISDGELQTPLLLFFLRLGEGGGGGGGGGGVVCTQDKKKCQDHCIFLITME